MRGVPAAFFLRTQKCVALFLPFVVKMAICHFQFHSLGRFVTSNRPMGLIFLNISFVINYTNIIVW
jgi:hypothetical protein